MVHLALSHDLARKVRQILANRHDFLVDGAQWKCGQVVMYLAGEQIVSDVARQSQHVGCFRLVGSILERCHSNEDYQVIGILSQEPIGVCMSRSAFEQLNGDDLSALSQFCQLTVELPERVAS